MLKKKKKKNHPRGKEKGLGKQAMNKTPASIIDKEEGFTFRIYIHTPPGAIPLILYGDRNR